MKRREFVIMAGRATALAALAGDTALLTGGCTCGSPGKVLVTKPDFEVPADPLWPKVTLARNVDHTKATRLALEAIGGIGRFVKNGERVLLKPNVAWDRVPLQAVNTNPVVVGEIVQQCMAAGASEVLVTDYGTHAPRRTFQRSGIRKAVEESGGKILLLSDNDFAEDDLKGRFISTWPVLKHIFSVDRLINMPIAKHHGLVFGTASMKNFFGAIGGNRGQLHRKIDQAIVDLAAYFRPTLTVVDATRVLMRNGPSGGALDDVVVFDSVICATDQVAADSRACEFLGVTASNISHVILAAEQGLGEIDYHKAGFREVT